MISIPLGMIAYTGIETISNMAEEAKDEATSIPRAINRVRLAVFAIYFTLPAVALSALPVEQVDGEYQTKLGLPEDEGGFAGDPILGVVKQIDLGPLQSAGELYVGILAATILFIATNAAIIGVSRLVYSMGIHRQLPDALRQLHPRFRTPWIGILVFSGVAILTILPGQADFLGLMYAFGAMLSFTIAHFAVITLRFTQPDVPRPYRGPWNVPFRGRRPPDVRRGRWRRDRPGVRRHRRPEPRRRRCRRRLAHARPHPVLALPPQPGPRPRLHPQGRDRRTRRRPRGGVRLRARPHRRPPSRRATLATAAKLAARKRRGIHVLVTITVPNAMDIDAAMPEAEAAARSIIEQANLQAGSRVSGHWEKVRAGQAGRRIIEEANDMRAAAVIMALPTRVSGGSVFGKTIETVLTERPCRVIIESRPQ